MRIFCWPIWSCNCTYIKEPKNQEAWLTESQWMDLGKECNYHEMTQEEPGNPHTYRYIYYILVITFKVQIFKWWCFGIKRYREGDYIFWNLKQSLEYCHHDPQKTTELNVGEDCEHTCPIHNAENMKVHLLSVHQLSRVLVSLKYKIFVCVHTYIIGTKFIMLCYQKHSILNYVD